MMIWKASSTGSNHHPLLSYFKEIVIKTTVHQTIVDPRLNFELLSDWLKIGHVV